MNKEHESIDGHSAILSIPHKDLKETNNSYQQKQRYVETMTKYVNYRKPIV